MKQRRTIGIPSQSAIDDAWQRQSTAVAIAAIRDLTKPGGVIPPGTQIGWLSDVELGWLVAAVLFAWISTRAEQATAEGLDTELALRVTGYDPDPWDAGAIATILPQLADTPGNDWSKPLADWPREVMIKFLNTALSLMRKAIVARDVGGGTITRKEGADELNDPIGI